jgi:hypothetical protein
MTIEKNIPIPPMFPPSKAKTQCIEAMRQMEVGDSFLFMGHQSDVRRAADTVGIYVTSRAHCNPQGMKIGWRVWRVAEPTKKSLVKRKPLTIALRQAA